MNFDLLKLKGLVTYTKNLIYLGRGGWANTGLLEVFSLPIEGKWV